MYRKVLFLLISSCLLIQLNGCSSDSSSADKTGTVKVSLTDAPGDYKAVYVTVDEIRVKKDDNCVDVNGTDCASSWITVANPMATINLLELQDGNITQLGEANISVGSYSHLRLYLGEQEDNGTNILGDTHPFANYLIFEGDDTAELDTPSDKLKEQSFSFDLNESGILEILIDFDANASVHQAGGSGKWILTPVLDIKGTHK